MTALFDAEHYILKYYIYIQTQTIRHEQYHENYRELQK